MQLSLIIPLYNESPRIGILVDGITRFASSSPHSFEVVLVNDGSSDGTGMQLDALPGTVAGRDGAAIPVKVIHLPRNAGKGAALRAGVAAAEGEWVLTLDADMATAPGQVLDWEKNRHVPLSEPPAGHRSIYIGSRDHPLSKVEDWAHRRFVGRVFNLLVQVIGGLYVDDSQCGFKLYPGHVAKRCFASLDEPGWAHDIAVLRRAEATGCRVIELPVEWHAVAESKVSVSRDAIRMFLALVRIRAFDFLKTAASAGPNSVADLTSLGLFALLAFIIGASALSGAPAPDAASWMRVAGPALGFLWLAGCWRLARDLGDPRAATLSLPLVASTPAVLGGISDFGFTTVGAGCIWTTHYLLEMYAQLPKLRKGVVFKLGAAAALTAWAFHAGGRGVADDSTVTGLFPAITESTLGLVIPGAVFCLVRLARRRRCGENPGMTAIVIALAAGATLTAMLCRTGCAAAALTAYALSLIALLAALSGAAFLAAAAKRAGLKALLAALLALALILQAVSVARLHPNGGAYRNILYALTGD